MQLLDEAEPSWLLVALALQAPTYVAQAGTWLTVLHRAGARIPFGYACALSRQMLFIDQALPSMGLSGTAAVAAALERRGVPRPAVTAAVAVDIGCYFAAYVLSVGTALAVFIRGGHASSLVVIAALLFLVIGASLAAAVLVLSGRAAGWRSHWLQRIPGIRRALELLAQADPHLARDPRLLPCSFDSLSEWVRHATTPSPVGRRGLVLECQTSQGASRGGA